jgi:hypothetical protein
MDKPLKQAKLSKEWVRRLQEYCDNDEQEELPIWRRPQPKAEPK